MVVDCRGGEQGKGEEGAELEAVRFGSRLIKSASAWPRIRERRPSGPEGQRWRGSTATDSRNSSAKVLEASCILRRKNERPAGCPRKGASAFASPRPRAETKTCQKRGRDVRYLYEKSKGREEATKRGDVKSKSGKECWIVRVVKEKRRVRRK